MLVLGIGALFAPHTPTTALGIIAGIAIAGDLTWRDGLPKSVMRAKADIYQARHRRV
jgi:hypothetical protein